MGPKTQTSTYPVIAVRDGIVFPKTENVLVFGRAKSIATINESLKKDKKMVLIMQKNVNEEDPKKEDLLTVGVLVSIEKTIIGEKGEVNAMVKGIEKVKIVEYTKEVPYFEAKVEQVPEVVEVGDEIDAMVKYISQQMKKAINHGKAVDFVFLMNILNVSTPSDFSYQIGAVLELKEDERQKLLEETSLKKRLQLEVEYINREVKILEIEQNISAKTQKKFERGMKETFLKEKMKTIEEELGGGDETKETKEYEIKIRKSGMPPEVEKKALKELKRLGGMSQFNPETSYVKNYLDWLIELPWRNDVGNAINVKAAETILNEDHYGLKKIKERILEYLAVLELRRSKEEGKEKGKDEKKKVFQPTIICFAGPPGVGKTSLGRSIARALGRKFVKVSLGGVRDEAEIRGHRRTYVGAMPGRIIQGIKQAGTKNPLFMLDEIDKIGRDYRGDASAALLEALDPEQNHAFSDHYLEVPYDLSDVFFITTANMLDTIPDALRDRLEIIHFPGYTVEEKFHIAKQYLVKKQQEAHSITTKEGSINDSALKLMISRYTREAGVRELERQVATVFRKRAREIVEKKEVVSIVNVEKLPSYLGPFKYSKNVLETKNTIGMSTGLAWTQVGGEVLFIEVAIMPGKGGLTLTGQLGDVMKESCQAALSYIRSRWDKFGLEQDFYQKIDIHVHVPEGAVPKDGPSAGLAITTAMISALTKNPFRKDVAMTGEMTLRGRALEIGGLKEKVIAAQTAGVKTIIIPKDNKKDLEDIPDNVKSKINFVFVEQADEVFPIALENKMK
ncbi:MAG: endopeptidase La [Candidatus Roizmanbacteria bacterium]|nr:endopeptidase La [Candidatus Roizmanbacteria bacterium]